MANLSNINNVLRVSSNLRVGINTDAASYALEIGGTNSGIKLKNSGASGRVYSLLSDTSGNFQIYDDAAASGRLVISSGGNATFAAKVFSTSTVSGDIGTTLVTKDYVDSGDGSSINTILITVAAVGGGNRYFLDGVQQANAVLQPGFTYRFDQSNATNNGHPLRFSTNNNNSPAAPYTTGVTAVGTPGSSGAYTQIITTQATPVTLYYYCTIHSGMGGAATIRIIQTDGNATFANSLGIGTSLPGSKLTVNKTKSGTGVENYDLIRLGLLGTGAVGDSSTIGWFSTSGTKTAGIEGISGLDNILYGELAFHVRRYTTDSYDRVMTINNRGNVGIGTALPTTKLTVNGGYANFTDGTVNIYTGSDGSGGLFGTITNHYQRFVTNNIERMRIDSSGNVGIAAIPGAVASNIRVLRIGQRGVFSAYTTSGNVYMSNNVRVIANGNNTAIVTGESAQYRQDGGTHIWYNAASVSAGAVSTLTERMRITSGGNVGIGMLVPNAKLDVYREMKVSFADSNQYTLRITNTDGNSRILADGSGAHLIFGTTPSGSSFADERMIIQNSGNVGIGATSPGEKLEINGNIRIYNSSNAPYIDFVESGAITDSKARITMDQIDGSNGTLLFATEGSGTLTERMRITSAGEVKIGTTTVNSNGLTIEKTGNHMFLRASTAVAGRYMNFDITSANDLYIINHSGTGVYLDSGATSWASSSDESLKENIKPLENVLDKIKNYRCVEYNLKSDDTKGKKIGFIAQDWENDFAPIVNKDKNNSLGMKYTETIPVLLKAIQELKAEIEILKNK